MDIDMQSRVPSPTFHTKHYHPYFTPAQVERLSAKHRGGQGEKQRQQACAFIEAIGGRIGFPRKTIATAQNLYHRFHLYFPRKDFGYHDVTLAALYVSTKMHDTLKKPQDILMVSYAVRFPELAAKSKAIGGDVAMDPEKVEQDRQRLLAIERLMLETICFNFTSKMPFPYIIKVGRALNATKELINLAWRLATDSSRTAAQLMYPPHCVALACVSLAALLLSFENPTSPCSVSECRTNAEVAALLGTNGSWETRFHSKLEDVQEIAHVIMDLLLHEASTSTLNPSAQTSPSTPQSPSPYSHSPLGSLGSPLPTIGIPSIPHRPDQLTRLKILMRENDVERERRRPDVTSPRENGNSAVDEAEGLGRNESTVRFLFGPPGSVLAGS